MARFTDLQQSLKMVAEQGQKQQNDAPPATVIPGEVLFMFCSQFSEWDRVVVLDVLPDQKLSVQSADYGAKYTESLSNARLFNEVAAQFPLRAVRCCLAGQ